MKKLTIALLATAVVLAMGAAGLALANDKPAPEHGPTAYVPQVAEGALAVGDDCTDPIVIGSLPFSATGQTNCGRGNTYASTCLGYYDGGEDVVYRLDLAAPAVLDIVMDPQGTTWSGMLIDDACPPDPASCIAISTGSSGAPRQFLGLELGAGTYYIMVDTWPSPSCIPSFTLTIEEGEPYPNPTCGTAIDLQDQSLVSFPVNTCGSVNDYSPTNGCTGYAANGEDAVYSIYLDMGEIIAVTLTGESYDASIYLLTDCSDMNSCVAGGDDPETFTYEAATSGVYYLIIDGYAAGGCGTSTVTIDAPVANGSTSWGQIKRTYR